MTYRDEGVRWWQWWPLRRQRTWSAWVGPDGRISLGDTPTDLVFGMWCRAEMKVGHFPGSLERWFDLEVVS